MINILFLFIIPRYISFLKYVLLTFPHLNIFDNKQLRKNIGLLLPFIGRTPTLLFVLVTFSLKVV